MAVACGRPNINQRDVLRSRKALFPEFCDLFMNAFIPPLDHKNRKNVVTVARNAVTCTQPVLSISPERLTVFFLRVFNNALPLFDMIVRF